VSETYVLDSFAVLALLCREVGSEEVSHLLCEAQEGKVNLLMTWVNVGEIAYIVERRWGKERLCQVLAMLEATEIEIVSVKRGLALAAGHIKAEHPLAYADAYAGALAMEREATLVTGDPEFEVLEGTISIYWLPRDN